MSTLPYLTDAEILGIVAPLRQPAAIVRWFRHEGFEVRVRPNGMPLISRAHFDAITSGPTATIQAPNNGEQPDVMALISRVKKGVGYGDHGPHQKKQPARAT